MARWKDVKKRKVDAPSSKKKQVKQKVIYAGFWSRFLAFVTDVFMIGIPIVLVIMMTFGYETIKNQPGFMDGVDAAMAQQAAKEKPQTNISKPQASNPSETQEPKKEPNPLVFMVTLSLWAVVILSFWYKTGQTPGKKMAKIVLVDAQSFKRPTLLQLLLRFLFLIMPLFSFMSIILMLLTRRKLTLHDMVARTSVIYKLD